MPLVTHYSRSSGGRVGDAEAEMDAIDETDVTDVTASMKQNVRSSRVTYDVRQYDIDIETSSSRK